VIRSRPQLKMILFCLLGAALLTSLIAAASLSWFWRSVQRPLALEAPHNINVAPGSSLRRVGNELSEAGILDHPSVLMLWARWQDQTRAIRAGEFALQPGMSKAALLELLVAGPMVQHPVLLIEGWRVRDALETLWRNEVIENTLQEHSESDIAALLDLPWPALEGAIYPDTYLVTRGTTDLAVLRRAAERLQRVLDEEWQRRDAGLPYETPYEALIMASIIEKESGIRDEKPRVSGVFVRRLQTGMRLQSDPTVIYGVGDAYAGVIRRSHLDTTTPWNTYRINGLPPTPIAIVPRDAIRAALQPADEPYFYFVARGDGSHHFSENLTEHNAAVRRYLRGGNSGDSP